MHSTLIITLGVLFGALSIFLIPYGFDLRNKEIQALSGELITPKVDFQRQFEVNIGSNILVSEVNALSQGINLRRFIDFGYDYPIQIRFKDGRLLISAEIKNQNGETIAKIKDNQWTVNNNKIIARDRNYNSYAFEVVDSELRPVLQVVVQDQNKIYIGGLFYTPNGTVLATPNGLFINPSDSQITDNIQPIFRYPSDKYLGQMIRFQRQDFLQTPLGIAAVIYGVATVVFLLLVVLEFVV